MIEAKQPTRVKSLLPRASSAGNRWHILLGVLISVISIVGAQAFISLRQDSALSSSGSAIGSESATKKLVYLLRDDGTHTFTLAAANPESNSFVWTITVGDCPIAKRSNDGQTLFLVDAETEVPYGSNLSAIDGRTGATIWRARLNTASALSYCNIIPSDRMWQSADGQYVYLMASQQKANKIVVFDTHARTVTRVVDVAVPYDSYDYKPHFWKLPWSEEMAVVSRDQLLLIDLNTGKTQQVSVLPGFTEQNAPKNLPQIVDVIGGDLAPCTKRLYLATLAQEVIAVNFDVTPPTIEQIIRLPTDWQFPMVNPLITQSDGQKVYVQVRQPKTRPPYSFDVDAIWIYESGKWAYPASRIELGNMPLLASALVRKPYLRSTGIALSDDGLNLYSVLDNSVLITTRKGMSESSGYTLMASSEPTNELAKSWIVR